MKEVEISDRFKKLLNKAGVLSYKMSVYVDPKSKKVYGVAGWPDWLIIVPGPDYNPWPVIQLMQHCVAMNSPLTLTPAQMRALLYSVSFYFVELKTVRGRLTAIQEKRIAALRYCGAYVTVLHGMPQVETWVGLMKAKHGL